MTFLIPPVGLIPHILVHHRPLSCPQRISLRIDTIVLNVLHCMFMLLIPFHMLLAPLTIPIRGREQFGVSVILLYRRFVQLMCMNILSITYTKCLGVPERLFS